ncbi:TPA: D-glycero-beta-D-manno-heptose 1-phosphate adenylyltransferase, partial [bacterium]|nr:D-glycero-beta-D-manno-heptose 1-phosphate adenylyltransferase [bacterium]
MREPRSKIKTIEELREILQALKDKGKRVVFTNGCFDILHIGHIRYLMGAKDYGDVLVVAINSDSSVQKIKGDLRPLVTQQERAEVLASLEAVDYVTIFEEPDPLCTILTLRPDVLVKGGDYKMEEVIGREVVEAGGGEVRIIPEIKGASTTGLIDLII